MSFIQLSCYILFLLLLGSLNGLTGLSQLSQRSGHGIVCTAHDILHIIVGSLAHIAELDLCLCHDVVCLGLRLANDLFLIHESLGFFLRNTDDGFCLALRLADDLCTVSNDGLCLTDLCRDRFTDLIEDLSGLFCVYKRLAAGKRKAPALFKNVIKFIN